MDFFKKNGRGLLLCLGISIPSWILGQYFPIIGAPVIGILLGMCIGMILKNKTPYKEGIRFTSKKILQYAVILLGFGLNLNIILQTGKESLPIIISTISTSLIIAFILQKTMNIPLKISTLIGVGSSICGGSAIAATAPVIDADEDEVAQAISVIFFFNVLAALFFPRLGMLLDFPTLSGHTFGVFAGTAINDTSSVTAAASTWDSMFSLGNQTLDTAVTVKLTRTLAIIPITLILGFLRIRNEEKNSQGKKINWLKIFPTFIIYFILASVITTVVTSMGADPNIFQPVKQLSKFFIVLAMSAIGINTNIVKLIKTGGKPILIGLCCWIGITLVSLMYLG